MPDIIQLMGFVLIFGSILYLAYIAARLVGKKTSASMQSKHMQVVEQISLGLDRRLLLIRVGTEYFLFLCGKKEFKQVARVKLDNEENQEPVEQKVTESAAFDFHHIFDKYLHNLKSKKEQQKDTPEKADSKQLKNEILQRNIHKLEQMREKSYDKEV